MEEFDDDFGDLYADVEVQVSSAINGIPGYPQSHSEPIHEDEEEQEDIGTTNKPSPNEGLGSNSKEPNPGLDGSGWKMMALEANCGKEMNVDNGSDSEDDLNIVLNDEDCKDLQVVGGEVVRNVGVVGGGEDEDDDDDFVGEGNGSGKSRNRGDSLGDGSELNSNGHGGERGNGVKGGYNSQYPQYKYMRHHGSAFPSNINGNGSAGMASHSSRLARCDWDDNVCNQQKGSSSVQVAYVRATPNSVAAQSGCGFSLPWYRTILDVNIDTFEEKPWRFPGGDITDFFNFGFNEDTWKQYCNSLEQFRRQAFGQTGVTVYESSKRNQAYEAGSEYEKKSHKALAEEINQVGLQRMVFPTSKFADSGVRQLEMPKGRAIQVEDSIGERQPSVDVRRPRTRDSDVVIQITVQGLVEDSSGSGKEEVGHIDSTVHEASENGDFNEDDSRSCSGNVIGDEPSLESAEGNIKRLDRCSQLTIAYNPKNLDSDNQENEKIPDVNGHHHGKVKVFPSEGLNKAMEAVVKKREVGRNSCSADPCTMETELSLDDCGQLSLDSSSYGSDFEASGDSFYIDTEKAHSPLRRPSVNSGAELPESVTSYHKNLRSSGSKTKPVDIEDDSRNKGSIQEERENHNRSCNCIGKPKMTTDNNDDASPILDAEDLCDKDHSLVNCRKQKERMQGFGCKDRDLSYHRETELSCHYGAENNVRTVYTKHSFRKDHQFLIDEIDPYIGKKRDEREYFHEQRSHRVDNEDGDRDWYQNGRGTSTDNMNHFTYGESRRLVSRHTSYTVKERDSRWRRKHGELQFRKRTNHNSSWFDGKREDNFVEEKYGRPTSFTDRKRDSYSLGEKYERQLPYIGRELENSGRRGRYGDSPPLDIDNSWSGEIQDEYQRRMGYQSLDSRLCRESYTSDEGYQHDTMSPRKDMYDSRLTERYGRHGRQICAGKVRDSGWLDSCNGVENCIIYPDDQAHLGRRRYNWRSKVLHWTEDEVILRHRDDDLYAEEASASYEKTSRQESIRSRYGSAHDGMLIDEMQVQRHRMKMIKEGSSTNCLNRSSNTIYRVKHEQAVLRCRDSVDLVVGEGKSSGRSFKAGSLMSNGRLENMDLKVAKMQKHLTENEPQREKAIQSKVPNGESNQNNVKWQDKLPITEQNEDLDIEEGQIVSEEPNKEDALERSEISEGAALTHNVKRRILNDESGCKGNKVVVGYDNQRILETLAKMEKRRERFKEPITSKKEPDKSPKSQVDLIVDTDETKQQRRTRKRRWGGS